MGRQLAGWGERLLAFSQPVLGWMTNNEIADLAGVSRATVSRYLNQGYVSEEKRERIRGVIEETGYQPSSQAQTLRTRKTKLIGVIIPKIDSHTISRMVGGISTVARGT